MNNEHFDNIFSFLQLTDIFHRATFQKFLVCSTLLIPVCQNEEYVLCQKIDGILEIASSDADVRLKMTKQYDMIECLITFPDIRMKIIKPLV